MKIFKYIFLSLTFILSINNILNCFEIINGTNKNLEARYYQDGSIIRLNLAPGKTVILNKLEQENNYTIRKSVFILDTDEFKLQIEILIENIIIILKEDTNGNIYVSSQDRFTSGSCNIL